MIPTEEEKQKIQEAQLANPDVPLGSAEQFLLTLSSISELSARLHLWAFKMDYEATEKVCINMRQHVIGASEAVSVKTDTVESPVASPPYRSG